MGPVGERCIRALQRAHRFAQNKAKVGISLPLFSDGGAACSILADRLSACFRCRIAGSSCPSGRDYIGHASRALHDRNTNRWIPCVYRQQTQAMRHFQQTMVEEISLERRSVRAGGERRQPRIPVGREGMKKWPALKLATALRFYLCWFPRPGSYPRRCSSWAASFIVWVFGAREIALLRWSWASAFLFRRL
jgi:hypothetical protein